MPTYDYLCDACEHQFEHRQSMTSSKLRTCPRCKKRKLRRLIGSGAGVIFKGSGFYETDYKRGPGGEKAAKKESKKESKKDAKAGSADAPGACTSDPTSCSGPCSTKDD